MNEAARFGDFDTLRCNLEKGVPVDVRDKYYKTPLMTACAQGNYKMASFLIDNGYVMFELWNWQCCKYFIDLEQKNNIEYVYYTL